MSEDPAVVYANPDFGKGRFHRRIRLNHQPNQVFAELEDCAHGFTVMLRYEGDTITSIDPRTLRIPLSTCPGAVEPLKAFTGQSISKRAEELIRAINPKQNCTHLYDLTVLAISHARRPHGVRVYDIIMPDEVDSPSTLSVLCDGETVLEWQVKEWEVTAPTEIAGKTLYLGFSAWLAEHCQGDAQMIEYGQMAQKGYLVSSSRRFDKDAFNGAPVEVMEGMDGICHTYTKGTIETAHHTIGTARDFSDCPEQLLTFQ